MQNSVTVPSSPNDNLPELTKMYFFLFYCFFKKLPPGVTTEQECVWRTSVPML